MKSLSSLLSIIALGFGLFGCAAKEEVLGTTTAAPYGVVGNVYSANLATSCNTLLLPWTVPSQGLPNGLSFNGVTGDVAGIPTVAGNFTVVFTKTDSTGKTESCSVLFAVRPRTDRVSVDINGISVTGATNREPSISSTDGRFIAFTSIASPTGLSLIAGVRGQQIYVHDRQTGLPSLISKDNFGIAGDGGSSAPSISADGRYVAFVSTSTNLVPGVSGQQIYLHDRQNGQTTLVSKDSFGVPATAGFSILSNTSPRVRADGQIIVFVSNATNLDPLFPSVISQQIYMHNRLTGQTSLVSQDNSGGLIAGNASSSSPSISTDGQNVAFASASTNLVAGVVTGPHVYVRNLPTNQTRLVSQDNSGGVIPVPGNGLSSTPSISADGQSVAFVSQATNLLGPVVPTVVAGQVYVRNLLTNQTRLVSQDNSGGVIPVPGNGLSSTPSISADGQSVAFVSQATNLLGPVVPTVVAGQAYVRDIQTNQTRLVSQDNSGGLVAGNGLSSAPSISADGRFVAFVSSAPNLVTVPPPGAALDVYVRAIP